MQTSLFILKYTTDAKTFIVRCYKICLSFTCPMETVAGSILSFFYLVFISLALKGVFCTRLGSKGSLRHGFARS